MYTYGIYPAGNSDLIPLAIHSNILFTHVYVSDVPLTQLSTRIEFKLSLSQALNILKEVSAKTYDAVRNTPSAAVYFSAAVSPKYDQARTMLGKKLLLNGRVIDIQGVSLGVFAVCAPGKIYDQEYTVIPSTPVFYINGNIVSLCSLCTHKDLIAGHKYCVYYEKAFMCFFNTALCKEITCEGFAEASIPNYMDAEQLGIVDTCASQYEEEHYGTSSIAEWEVEA